MASCKEGRYKVEPRIFNVFIHHQTVTEYKTEKNMKEKYKEDHAYTHAHAQMQRQPTDTKTKYKRPQYSLTTRAPQHAMSKGQALKAEPTQEI